MCRLSQKRALLAEKHQVAGCSQALYKASLIFSETYDWSRTCGADNMLYRNVILASVITAAIACGQSPSELTVPAGAWISARVDQVLSSDRNQPGDEFSMTLTQPLVANGFVVARRGQTISGRVVDAVKAGRVKGTSRLSLELTDLTLVDGQQVQVRTQLVQYSGGTSQGRDATAIATATGVGAAAGAAADGGRGAGIGAAAGAAASTVGVLLTRGRATEVYPEAVLTFRTQDPITISTDRSSQAFAPVRQEDYESEPQARHPQLARRGPGYGGYPYPVYGSVGVVIVTGGGRHR
jgi:hypothetical protein